MNVKPILGVIIGITLVTALGASPLQQIYAAIEDGAQVSRNTENNQQPFTQTRAPIASSGENVYMAWWTNNTSNGNNEVMFRSSTNGGQTFGDKINLSNTTDADSTRVEIDEEGDSVFVSWWETNQTSDTPVMRVSTDNGATFGPILRLATNGTIGEAEGTEE
jgi:hypothetical protein